MKPSTSAIARRGIEVDEKGIIYHIDCIYSRGRNEEGGFSGFSGESQVEGAKETRRRKQKRSKTGASRTRVAKGSREREGERDREGGGRGKAMWERKKDGREQTLDPYIFQLVAQSAYKRIAIAIKARSLLPCEVIATISPDAFSALRRSPTVINARLAAAEEDERRNGARDLNLRNCHAEKPAARDRSRSN